MSKPTDRPRRPHFSSGPCAKRPGWTPSVLAEAPVGRSHRSKPGKAKLAEAIERTRAILNVPADHRIGIVPASDTGAYEMAMWSLLGARPVEMLAWESFGQGWVTDAQKQLKLDNCQIKTADYGEIVDLAGVNAAEHDVCFTWNGTTSGVKVPDGDWIPANRDGLTLVDATSAAFAMDLPWDKIDVATFSWQKVMGGEAAHGVLILSPRAVQRLESYTPPWPLPKIFRLTKGGKLNEGIFEGATINTPSMLCVEDYLDALKWGEQVGGLNGLIKRSERNLAVLEDWVAKRDWIDFLAADKAIRSNTSVCLKIVDDWFAGLDAEARAQVPKKIDALLQGEGVAYDINGYRDAPPGLRIWCGATVDTDDVAALTGWIDWAYETVKADF
ncbi:phosphoserine aminotransferase [Rhodothalassium salexigens DSM 2132]|uniref:phosphoserine transaminase n=1 Tax=Rhodothalassium salexigens DSM 2132 TaxID=1188247 RepID=A0A4R2PRR4_RHOSA|nr:phosphoserine transaminase [Rhodothalassium salexigens]MBB4210700.1 phosphoserine aminotransferase [Rhodothalassium salexigens DSM 2132]MBK1637901.1 phosphoserine transaminase [Rhodothalassium salexigens DSM 2132]TCP37744.1 phosphoserine aminotransferase [Rhodothalassium salexigens DSM 2132]